MRISVIVMAFAAAGAVWMTRSEYIPVQNPIALSSPGSTHSLDSDSLGNPMENHFGTPTSLDVKIASATNATTNSIPTDSNTEAPTFFSSHARPLKAKTSEVKTIGSTNRPNLPTPEQFLAHKQPVTSHARQQYDAADKSADKVKTVIQDNLQENLPQGIPLDPESFPSDAMMRPLQAFGVQQTHTKTLQKPAVKTPRVPEPLAIPKKTVPVHKVRPQQLPQRMQTNTGTHPTKRWGTRKTIPTPEIDLTRRLVADVRGYAKIQLGTPSPFPSENTNSNLHNISSANSVQPFGTGGSASVLELSGLIEESKETQEQRNSVPLHSHDPTMLEPVVEFLPPPPKKNLGLGMNSDTVSNTDSNTVEEGLIGYVELPPPPIKHRVKHRRASGQTQQRTPQQKRRPLPVREYYQPRQPVYVPAF